MAEPSPSTRKKRPSAKTPEAREAQLVNKAFAFAEEQFDAGTASSQVTTHFLKLGSIREDLEREKLRRENLLLEAKVKQIESQAELKELFTDAMEALTGYRKGPEL